ncbi:MAG: hypothetical protein WC955_11685 [Elusimicrobiota bacterium]
MQYILGLIIFVIILAVISVFVSFLWTFIVIAGVIAVLGFVIYTIAEILGIRLCRKCFVKLIKVEQAEVVDISEDGNRQDVTTQYACPRCKRVYEYKDRV